MGIIVLIPLTPLILGVLIMIISAVCSPLFDGKDFQTGRGKKNSEVCLQKYWACIIAAMLVYNREMTAAKRKLVDDFINNPKVCGSVSNADFWMLIEKQMIEPDNLDEALKLAAGKLALDERMKLAHLLFKLSVEDDGIMNDEWDLLKKVVSNLKFAKQYTDHLFKFYGPLRSFSDTAIYNKLHGHLKQRKKEETQNNDKNAAKSSGSRSRTSGANSQYAKSRNQSGGGYSSGGSSYSQETSSSRQGGTAQQSAVNPLAKHYAMLGLTPVATADEVLDAYRSLAKQHHPDLPKNVGRQEECVELMAKINAAYDAISASLN